MSKAFLRILTVYVAEREIERDRDIEIERVCLRYRTESCRLGFR